MILLWLSLAFGAGCERNLKQQAFFSPTVIAKAIGRFTNPLEQQIFSAVVRAYDYDAIARHFKVTLATVLDIAHRGGEYLIIEKKEEGTP